MKVKLGDLTKIRTGKLDANASSPNGKYPFFTCSKEPLRINSHSYDCECVLVAGNGDLNVKYYNGKFDAYQRTYIIEDNGSNQLYMPYLYYFMEGYVEELRKLSIGGVIKYIKLGNLTEALIELPKIEDQRTIVDILNKSKRILSYHQQQLQKLDELVKARFVELFGSVDDNQKNIKTIRVGDACTLINGRAFKPDEWSTEGLPIVRIQNLNSEEAPFNYYSGEVKSQHLINSGDLLFSWSGTPGTSFGAFFWRRGKAALNQHIFKVIPNCDYNLFFLQYALNERLNFIISRAHGGVGLQHITKKELDEVLLFQPGINEQNDFATFVEQVDKSKVAVQKSLDEAQLLFDSLMQQYFG